MPDREPSAGSSGNYTPTLETIRGKHHRGASLYVEDEIEVLLAAVAERDRQVVEYERRLGDMHGDVLKLQALNAAKDQKIRDAIFCDPARTPTSVDRLLQDALALTPPDVRARQERVQAVIEAALAWRAKREQSYGNTAELSVLWATLAALTAPSVEGQR